MSNYELVTVTRDCKVITIPYGTESLLFQDEKVYITQTLGGSFTVQRDNGQLARVSGTDADALGKEVKTCFDPEIPVNIVELGLIYGCIIKTIPEGGKRVEVVMTLTAPGCGMSTVLKNEIEEKLKRIKGVREALVDVTFEPPWNQSLMTEAARLQLGMM